MSWSINLMGKPEDVARALQAQSETLSGQSKAEFDDALPHLMALVRQNFVDAEHCHYPAPFLYIEASGSGSARRTGDVDRQVERSCSVKIGRHYSTLV